MIAQWKPSSEKCIWRLSKECIEYQQKYDKILEQLDKLSYADELLSGNCTL